MEKIDSSVIRQIRAVWFNPRYTLACRLQFLQAIKQEADSLLQAYEQEETPRQMVENQVM